MTLTIGRDSKQYFYIFEDIHRDNVVLRKWRMSMLFIWL